MMEILYKQISSLEKIRSLEDLKKASDLTKNTIAAGESFFIKFQLHLMQN